MRRHLYIGEEVSEVESDQPESNSDSSDAESGEEMVEVVTERTSPSPFFLSSPYFGLPQRLECTVMSQQPEV